MVSSLYIWFHTDFGDFDAAIPQQLQLYAGPTLKSALDGQETIGDHRNNWASTGQI
jgi:hypothetical protein